MRDIQQFGRHISADFEGQLIKMLIGKKEKKGDVWERDARFGYKALPVVSEDYFFSSVAKDIIRSIKEFYQKNFKIPYYDTLKSYIFTRPGINVDYKKRVNDYFNYLNELYVESEEFIEQTTENFILHQRLVLSVNHTVSILSEQKYDKYKSIPDLFHRATAVDFKSSEPYLMTSGDDSDLEDERRIPITTGIKELDKITNGGLSRSELGLIIAGLKVGKTTTASVLANSAALAGYNVLQLFFEDTINQIKTKHRSRFSGVGLSAIMSGKNEKKVKRKTDSQLDKIHESGGALILHKMSSVDTTVNDIRRVLLNIEKVGVYNKKTGKREKRKIDMLLIDYLEPIQPDSKYEKGWEGEGEVLRSIENMISKEQLNIACWAFTQGTRGSINTEIVDVEDMGGNIKKAQIAHFVMTISKTNAQRTKGLANVLIAGSRFGEAGIFIKDCLFDNGTMTIEFGEKASFYELVKEGEDES